MLLPPPFLRRDSEKKKWLPEPGGTKKGTFKQVGGTIHLDDLLSQAFWLNSFAMDVMQALTRSYGGAELEIIDPIPNPPK